MVRVDFITNRFFSSRTYVISCDGYDDVCLVDCGDTDVVVESYAKSKNIKCVFLTHTHADHIYGLNRLVELFPEVKGYSNRFGSEALSSPRLNLTRYHEEVPDFEMLYKENICVVDEGDRVELFNGVYADVFSTVGHDASCLTYKIDRYLFTGDSYMPGMPVVAKFPKSDKIQAVNSEMRIKDLAENLVVCPGHTL